MLGRCQIANASWQVQTKWVGRPTGGRWCCKPEMQVQILSDPLNQGVVKWLIIPRLGRGDGGSIPSTLTLDLVKPAVVVQW